MPKQGQRAEVNSFIKGIITEATVLNFPQGASADEINFELNRDGSRQRRLGMDFEPSFNQHFSGYTAGSATEVAYGTFQWNSIGGNPNLNYQVVQVGQIVSFYDLSKTNMTQDGFYGSVTLNFPLDVKYSFSSVEGRLVVVGGTFQFAIIELQGSTVFTVEYQSIQVRDQWGLEEHLAGYATDDSFRGGTTDGNHYYNLNNQSWGIPRKNSGGAMQDAVDIYHNGLNLYPSNSEQVWAGLQFQPVQTGQQPFERVYTNLYEEVLGAKNLAAKGYFIIDLLQRGASRQFAYDNNRAKYPQNGFAVIIPADATTGGAACTAEFAGHVFFSGFNGGLIGGDAKTPVLTNYVAFSQLVKNKTDIQKCYQEGDPTSRDSPDIVATDGGIVRVSGAKKIVAMRNLGTHLIVFSDNGIWSITGGTQDSGFDATNYKVNKISTFGCINESSIVVENGTAYYWSDDGIYVVAKNQYGDFEVSSLTLSTIQTLYRAIPNISKTKAFGEYDQIAKKVRWIYKTNTIFSVSNITYELIFDSAVGSFTRNLIQNTPSNQVEVVAMFRSQTSTAVSTDDQVVVNTDNVLVNTDNVVVGISTPASQVQFMRYVTISSISGGSFVSIAYYRDTAWTDWISFDGVGTDAKAFCLTGTITSGDSAVDKQTPYLVMHFVRTESGVDDNFQPLHQSSCFIRSQWEFANSVVSNKWSSLTQAYRYRKPQLVESLSDTYDTGFSVITTKNKLRGKGKAFALYFETEAKKDCQILGWNITVNGNQIT